MRTMRQLDFWLVFVVMALGQCSCFGQVIAKPDAKRERIDRYYSLIAQERWSDALDIFQSFSPSDFPGFITNHLRLRILTGDYEEADRLVESSEQAITDAWSLAALGTWFFEKSPSKCRAYLTKSLDLDPSPYATKCAIALALKQKELRFAMESLRKLHKRHPIYMGGYAVDNGFQLDAAGREFGKEQVTKACKDRPKLAPLITGSPHIQEWMIQRFGGIFIGRRAAWINTRTDALGKFVHPACHKPATTFEDAEVWVSPELDGENQFAALVYELLNAENSDETNELVAKVWSRQIGLEGFLREMGKLEHRALLKRRAFFVVGYFAGEFSETFSPEPWYLDVDTEFEEFYKSQPKVENYVNYFEAIQRLDKHVEVDTSWTGSKFIHDEAIIKSAD